MQTRTTCPACGTQNDADATYCTWCGTSLTVRASQPTSRRLVAGVVVLIVLVAGVLAFFLFGRKQAVGDVITYEAPLNAGVLPFTSPVDVSAARVGAKIEALPEGARPRTGGRGPFGGSGFNTVCDRQKLIEFLQDHPDRLKAWAGVLKVDPATVPAFIRGLRPVTLAEDTRVTNHSFVNGHATAHQSVLPAGTAVLVDPAGNVAVRCRCGNPLLPPRPVTTGVCRGCPRGYRLPRLLGPGAVPRVLLVINPPGGAAAAGAFAGTWTLSNFTVQGQGCQLQAQAGTMAVTQTGSTISVNALDLLGSGAVGADGSFSFTVSGRGQSGVLQGAFAGNQLSGSLTTVGCIVHFTGTRS